MPRVPVVVRDAVVADATRLGDLWAELCPTPGLDGGASREAVVTDALVRLQGDPTNRVVVAELEGVVVGCAFLRVALASPLRQELGVHITHLQVDPAYARQGAGRALIEASLTWAEQNGVDALLVAAPVHDRDANRVLARLGLQQVAVVRAGSVAALRARLPTAAPTTTERRRISRNVGQVVAVRRSQRVAQRQRAARPRPAGPADAVS